ncbi:hypothetical protein IC762_09840 [Bradyrhizobium genosp. L]|uniref:hypothetical protein n=1 Tax=Bradyrhizobium genosp. L TaxID=83637 RepID=UPI0018A2853E|nr:hypothetical protein [Bradyrhizobium genosp. L]QPF86552.1 hypothetical protein IC762_09840 [Bradyrhizobium genosp. L]
MTQRSQNRHSRACELPSASVTAFDLVRGSVDDGASQSRRAIGTQYRSDVMVLMPTTPKDQLERLERDIEAHLQADEAALARRDRELYLWTAEDRLEWQETRAGNLERLNELFEERDALQRKLGIASSEAGQSRKQSTGTAFAAALSLK